MRQYLDTKVRENPPASRVAIFLAPYYGWVVERLVGAIRPDTSQGEAPEVPRYESSRGAGSTADLDFWTSRSVYPVAKSHVNYVVADTKRREQSAAYLLDKHPRVEAFVKNAGLGCAIPYLDNGAPHDYVPDFIVRLKTEPRCHLVLEVKGHDPLEDVKRAAAERWAAAVSADGTYGRWRYAVAKAPADVGRIIEAVVAGAQGEVIG